MSAAVPPAAGESRARLWFGVAGPPLAWAVDELTSLWLHESSCMVFGNPTLLGQPFARVALIVVGALMLTAAVVAGLTAFAIHRRLGASSGGDGLILDQDRFMAGAGVLIAMIFGFGLLLRFITAFIVPPCR